MQVSETNNKLCYWLKHQGMKGRGPKLESLTTDCNYYFWFLVHTNINLLKFSILVNIIQVLH